MASTYHSLFTEKGLELLRTAIQSGSKLGITHMSFGDGGGILPTPNAAFAEMVKEVYRVPLNRLAASKENSNWLEADGVIPSAVGGFTIREVGLWAGNVMVAYANYPPTYKPSADQGTAQIKTIRIVLQIDNTANFELKIDASVVMATVQYVDDLMNDTVAFASDLKTTFPNKSGKYYVKELDKYYNYLTISLEEPNDVSVIQSSVVEGKWVMSTQDEYYASWFALPNVQEDQAKKLQAGLDYATSIGKPFIIDNLYYIKASQLHKDNNVGLIIRSKSHTKFTKNGKLKLITDHTAGYSVLFVKDIDDYIVDYPNIEGDRLENKYIQNGGTTTAEWGYGITIYQSKNGFWNKPIVKNMMGDGIYIGKAWGTTTDDVPTNTHVFEPTISYCRRNGLSMTAWNNVKVTRPDISKIGDNDGIPGTYPKACIDIEPEFKSGTVKPYGLNGLIEDPILYDSYAGLYIYMFPDEINVDLHIKGTVKIKNCATTTMGLFHSGKDCAGQILIDHIAVEPNVYVGLLHGWNEQSNLRCVISKLTIDPKVTKFEINYKVQGTLESKKLGNLVVDNIFHHPSTEVILAFNSDMSEYTDVSCKLFKDRASNNPINVWRSNENFNINFGDQAIIDSFLIHNGWSTSSTKFSNSIWLDPSVNTAGDQSIYINTANDFRKLKIGLYPQTAIIGNGCNIQGLNLLIGGVAKTRAHTVDPGAWIEFQNTENGRTVVSNIFGNWTYS